MLIFLLAKVTRAVGVVAQDAAGAVGRRELGQGRRLGKLEAGQIDGPQRFRHVHEEADVFPADVADGGVLLERELFNHPHLLDALPAAQSLG